MSRSKSDRFEKAPKPPKPHVRMILCDNCRERYPESEISVEVDEATKKVVGRFWVECV
jgi:hypothetical protein